MPDSTPEPAVTRDEVLATLETMPALLEAAFAGLAAAEAVQPGPYGSFSPVEHCWHLADLERDGYATRIRRLLTEDDPWLPDFDGERVARERQYRTLSLVEGLLAFRAARAQTLSALRAIQPGEWTRTGQQQGVGRIRLGDLPSMMAAHDASHRREIEAWRLSRRP